MLLAFAEVLNIHFEESQWLYELDVSLATAQSNKLALDALEVVLTSYAPLLSFKPFFH